MTNEEHIQKLYTLGKGQTHVYYNTHQPGRPQMLMGRVYKMYEEGRVQLTQQRKGNGSLDYIATGLLSDTQRNARKTPKSA